MLNVESITVIPVGKVPAPKRTTMLRAQVEKLLPKIAALQTGQALIIPYEANGKKWRGRQYRSAIEIAMRDAMKRGDLDRWYDLRKDASHIYIIKLKPQANGSK
jgi:hypothetical protein